MAKYRPIDLRLWSDRKFLSLSDDGRMLWLFLLSTPQTLPIPGVIVAGQAAIAELLGWLPERLGEGFRELSRKGLQVAVDGRLVWLKNGLRYQPPTSPNVISGWAKTWDDIPEGNLKHELWQALKIACKRWDRSFLKLFPEPFREGSPNPIGNPSPNPIGNPSGMGLRQDQDQDQDQDQERESALPADPEPEQNPPPPEPPGERRLPRKIQGTPDTRAHRIRLANEAWAHASSEHTRIKLALGSEARSWPPMPGLQFPPFEELLARIAELTPGETPDFTAARERLWNRIAVAAAEAEVKRSLDFFTPHWLWKREQFARADGEDPAAIRRRAGSVSAGDPVQPLRFVLPGDL